MVPAIKPRAPEAQQRTPRAWGQVGEMFMECGGAMSLSDLREVGEDRELSGYTFPEPRYPPDYPQQGRA